MPPCLETRGGLAAQRQTLLYLLPSEASPHCPLAQTQPGHLQRKVALRTSTLIPYHLTIQKSPREWLQQTHVKFPSQTRAPSLPNAPNPSCSQNHSAPGVISCPSSSSPPLAGFGMHSLLQLPTVPVSVAATLR